MRENYAGDVIAEAIRLTMESVNESDRNMEPANVVNGLFAVSRALRSLGMNNALTEMGAIEMLALEVKEGTTRIADAMNRIADAIEDRPH